MFVSVTRDQMFSISRPQPKYNISSLNTGKEYKGVYKIAEKIY